MNLRSLQWMVSVPVLCAAISLASAQESQSTGIVSCAAETNDTRRLHCYDTEIARLMRDGMTVPVIAPRIDQAALEDEFGMRGTVLRKANEKRQLANPRIEKLVSSVLAVGPSPAGRLLFDLENGQQWEQTEGNPAIFVKPGDSVNLTRGTMGSFWMTTEQRRQIKVRRLR